MYSLEKLHSGRRALVDAVELQHVPGGVCLGSGLVPLSSARSRGGRASSCSYLIPEAQLVFELLGGDEIPQHLFLARMAGATEPSQMKPNLRTKSLSKKQ